MDEDGAANPSDQRGHKRRRQSSLDVAVRVIGPQGQVYFDSETGERDPEGPGRFIDAAVDAGLIV